MPKSPVEPTNLVLEQLRVMRDELRLLRADVAERFNTIDSDISDVKKELRGLKLNTIAEVYKANLTVASFADHEQRIRALETKASPTSV